MQGLRIMRIRWKIWYAKWRLNFKGFGNDFCYAFLASRSTGAVVTNKWRKRKPFPFVLHIVDNKFFLVMGIHWTVNCECVFLVHMITSFLLLFYCGKGQIQASVLSLIRRWGYA